MPPFDTTADDGFQARDNNSGGAEVKIFATKPQCEFLALPHKFKAFVAGYGGGKTYVGCMDACLHYWRHPGFNQGYFAPTYGLIRDVYYPTIDEVAYALGMTVEIKENNKEVHFYSGPAYRGTTICRSLDNPETIVGFKIARGHIDEFDLLPINKAKLAWRKIIARMRYKAPGIVNGIVVTTTPEGYRATYDIFEEAPRENPELRRTYGLVRASTLDNEANLPSDYIQSLYDAYPAELVDAYVEGRFVNMTSGTVYKYYNREIHNSNETILPGEPLFIGMDFNYTKMAATIYVQRTNGWHAVAELKDVFDTPTIIKMLQERYHAPGKPRHRVIVYPDATGGGHRSVDASKSDLELLHRGGFEVRNYPVNPAVKDRVIAVNKRFELGKLFVNWRACPVVAKCLEAQVYDVNGEPDKKQGFDHQNDATGYPIAYEFPIVRGPALVRLGGI